MQHLTGLSGNQCLTKLQRSCSHFKVLSPGGKTQCSCSPPSRPIRVQPASGSIQTTKLPKSSVGLYKRIFKERGHFFKTRINKIYSSTRSDPPLLPPNLLCNLSAKLGSLSELWIHFVILFFFLYICICGHISLFFQR